MIKKLIFLSIAFMALNSFSYMELSFGIGNRSIDYKELTTDEGYEPHGGNIFVSFEGYTDQNALYGVSYSAFEHDLLDAGDQVDFEIETLSLMGGYAFGDPSEGAFFVKAKYLDTEFSAAAVGISVNLVDFDGFFISAGYLKQSADDMNWSVELQTDVDSNKFECTLMNCTVLTGGVDFQIPNSNWNFGLDLSISEYGETLNIGPTVKF